MAAEPSGAHLPIAAEFQTSSEEHIASTSPDPRDREENCEILETMESRVIDDRFDEASPNTVVDQDDDSDADSTPPVPPVPQSLSRKGSRARVRRNMPKDYSSDPQMYGHPTDFSPRGQSTSSRSNRPRFQDDWGESDGPYSSDRAWREEVRHPDFYNERRSHSRKPPRSHLNARASRQGFHDTQQNSPHKQWIDETQASMVDPFSPVQPNMRGGWYDEEMGYGGGPDMYGNRLRSMYSNEGPRIQWNSLTKEQKAEVLRLPWLQWMNSSVKNHFVATMGELIGTTMFLFFAFAGTEVANIQSRANDSSSSNDSNTTTGDATGFNVAVLMYISLSFGFSLMVNVWVFFRISGGLFNPAVTLAMLLIGAINGVRAVCLFIAQICGGMLASVLVRFLFPENFNVRTTLGGGTSIAQGIFIEALLTAELVFTIYMLAAEKHRATFIAPVGIGMALFIAELVGVYFTGGSLNPARSFGPCVITATFDSEHWIYWLGPALGACIAWAFYRFIKMLEYEMANPGADGDPLNDPTKNPLKAAELKVARNKSSLASVKTESQSI